MGYIPGTPLSPCCKAQVELALGLTPTDDLEHPGEFLVAWTCPQCGSGGFQLLGKADVAEIRAHLLK